jgi:hypothetical protein
MITFKELITVEGVTQPIPDHIKLHKIIQFHHYPLNKVREKFGQPIFVRSCFRPETWELTKSRKGTSQHCFEGDSKGAVDVSVTKWGLGDVNKMFQLAQGLAINGYKRLCFYPSAEGFFIHADYKNTHEKIQFFIGAKWENVEAEQFYKAILNDKV